MLGQHPELYGLPETSLLCAETVEQWVSICGTANFPMSHGLLRSIAELIYGEQSEANIQRAWGWLRRRNHCTTGYILELLAERVGSKLLVEKSPSVVYSAESLGRTHEMFPRARYLHLVRHPRGHCESVMKHIRKAREEGPVPGWLLRLGSFSLTSRPIGTTQQRPLDPQYGWFVLHTNISAFLSSVAPENKMRIRGEDLLLFPNQSLRVVVEWLGVRSDDKVLEEMMHPECWAYAKLGPANARFGMDRFFLEEPMLRPGRAELLSLDGPLSWRTDGTGFAPHVKRLAVEFGYN
jgi:hypothetical protein